MKNPLKALVSGSPGARKLAWTILIAIVVAALTLAGGGRKIVEAYEGMTSADTMTRISAALSGAGERATPVTLIAVDDETRAKWGNPVITPHATLARLIRIARENGARAILLDIDLSSDTPDQAPEPALYNEFAHSPEGGPLLMLVRSIRFRGEEGGHGSPRFSANSVRRTPYDRLIGETGKAVWVSAIPVFTGDRVVRKIRLWQTVCDGSSGETYASPALYVAAVLDAPSGRRAELDQFLKTRVAAECGGSREVAADWPKRRSPDVALEFVIGANDEAAEGKTTVSGGRTVPLFRELGAWTLLKVTGEQIETAGVIDASPFEDRVVAIGVTHADSRDIYATPLGTQAGVMILANAVAAAHVMADAPELSALTESAIAVALFLLFAIVGSRVHLTVTTIAVGLFSGFLVMILTRHIGFDAAIRIIALALTLYALHHVINSLVGIVLAWRGGLGWRAILVGRTGH